MEINADIKILRDTLIRLQGACGNLPGILSEMASSDTMPLQELERRLEAEISEKNAAASRASNIRYQIDQKRAVYNEAEERNISWMVAEYNKEVANVRNSDAKISELRRQISELQNSFNNLKHYINNFIYSDMNSLSTANSGVNSLIQAIEEYKNIL